MIIGLQLEGVSGRQFIATFDERRMIMKHVSKLGSKVSCNNHISNLTILYRGLSALTNFHEILDGAFFSVDGMSTGCIFMPTQKLILAVPRRFFSISSQ